MCEELVDKYIRNTEPVFTEIKFLDEALHVDGAKINDVIDDAKRYLEDAKYYRGKKQYKTSLVSIAYCEGLLDALKTLGVVDFTWTAKKREELF